MPSTTEERQELLIKVAKRMEKENTVQKRKQK
jgi:hypothetical protein